jgi:hypothetical protein
MTSVFQARRRAEDFASAVDNDAERNAHRGEEFATMLRVVESLREHQPVEPRADFTSDLRSRLMLEAETTLRPETANLVLPARTRGRRERRLVAAASAFVLIGGTTTMAAAAQGSLPGEALYPIKRGIEQAEAGLSLSSAGKGRDLLNQASDRLVEVRGLVETDASNPGQGAPQVPETLDDFGSAARQGSTLMFEDFRETGDPESIVAVRTFTAEAIAALEELADTVPADAQDELTAAAMLLHDIDAEAGALCSGCAPEIPTLEVPPIFLARADVDRALLRVSGRELSNDHPVVVHRDTVDEAAGTAAGSKPDGEATVSATPTTPPSLPAPTLDPSTWPSLLPGLDGSGAGGPSAGNKSTDGSSVTKDLTKELEDGIDDVVSTLLPEVGGSLG